MVYNEHKSNREYKIGECLMEMKVENLGFDHNINCNECKEEQALVRTEWSNFGKPEELGANCWKEWLTFNNEEDEPVQVIQEGPRPVPMETF